MALDALENHFLPPELTLIRLFSRGSIAVAPPGLTTHLKLPEGTPEISDWGVTLRFQGGIMDYCSSIVQCPK